MKKQLIAVGLAGLLTVPTVSFGAEMEGIGRAKSVRFIQGWSYFWYRN